jgi:hypothetical protein
MATVRHLDKGVCVAQKGTVTAAPFAFDCGVPWPGSVQRQRLVPSGVCEPNGPKRVFQSCSAIR